MLMITPPPGYTKTYGTYTDTFPKKPERFSGTRYGRDARSSAHTDSRKTREMVNLLELDLESEIAPELAKKARRRYGRIRCSG